MKILNIFMTQIERIFSFIFVVSNSFLVMIELTRVTTLIVICSLPLQSSHSHQNQAY